MLVDKGGCIRDGLIQSTGEVVDPESLGSAETVDSSLGSRGKSRSGEENSLDFGTHTFFM